jgi:uncharacterized protein with PQ loop repeat
MNGGRCDREMKITRPEMYRLAVLGLVLLVSGACQTIEIQDARSLLSPHLQKSEVWGLVAGFGTTFAAVPDMITMFKRRSSEGMNPRMAAILGVFQATWIYYGLLIDSRPVIVWNLIAVIINFLNVGAVAYLRARSRPPSPQLPA